MDPTFFACCSHVYNSHLFITGRPPVIIKQPSDVVAAKNSPADLECGVLEPSKATIHWLHNSVKVEDDAKRVTMDDGSLHFVRVTRNRKRTHAGIYQCVASNSYGTTRSRNASLIVGSEFTFYIFQLESKEYNVEIIMVVFIWVQKAQKLLVVVGWTWGLKLEKCSLFQIFDWLQSLTSHIVHMELFNIFTLFLGTLNGQTYKF